MRSWWVDGLEKEEGGGMREKRVDGPGKGVRMREKR